MADGGQNMVERRPNVPEVGAGNVERESALSEVLETHLLDVGRFKESPRGEIADIKTIGETVATLRKVDDHFEGAVFNPKGDASRVILDPSSHDLVKQSGKERMVLAKPLTGNWPPSGFSVLTSIKEIGYSPQTVERLVREFLEKAQTSLDVHDTYGRYNYTRYITKNQINSKPPLFLKVGDWNLVISENKRKNQTFKSFVFTAEDNYFEVPPNAPDKYSRLKTKEGIQNEDILLSDDLTIEKNVIDSGGRNCFRISKAGRQLAFYIGDSVKIDPADPDGLFYITNGKVYRSDLQGFRKEVVEPNIKPIDLPDVQDPKTLNFDGNGNFFIITTGENKLQIVDRESGSAVRTFENAKGPVTIDEKGNILFSDTDNRLREIQTNFPVITKEGAEELFRKKEEALLQEKERLAKLELEKVEPPQRAISQSDVTSTLRETISRQVSEKISQSSDPEELEDVLARLQTLKADPANQAYGRVIDEFVGEAREKLSNVRATELEGSLNSYNQVLDSVSNAEDSIGLDQEFAKLLEARQKTEITDYSKRREVDQRIREVQERKDSLISQYQQELVQGVEDRFPQIQELVEECGSTHELAYLSTSGDVQHFEMMMANIRDPEIRRSFRERYNSIRSGRREMLEERGRELEKRQVEISAQIIEDARESLKELQEQVEHLGSVGEVYRFGADPLVASWRAKLSSLPPELREIEEKRLEIILGYREKELEKREELTAVDEQGVLHFGNTTFPVFKEPPKIWQPKLTQRKGGFSGMADLTFEDTQGRVWKPEQEHDVVVNSDMSDERTRETIDRYRQKADEYFRGLKRKVPEFDEHWRITEYHTQKLEEIAEALNLQLINHRGILILQGEAGTGKNANIDMIANLSNREVVTIACNENTVKEDLTYEFYYDPEKGTYKMPSKLVEGIQKPGAIVVWDEINALKPGIAKLHNSLFDYRRRIFLPEGGEEREIIADPTVLFVGTMNPQNYVGVNRLSPEVKSRSRVIDIDYPPFDEVRGGRTYYRSDEAEMLAVHMDPLGELNQREFRLVWDYVINRDTTNGADRIIGGDQTIEQDTRRIYDVIRVANRLRGMYEAYQIGDSNEPMDFPTSLREVIDIALEMNHRQGVKPILKRVIIPKIDDRRQKRLVEQTIDAVLPD